MITERLKNMQVQPGDLQHRDPQTIRSGAVVVRADGTRVRLLHDVHVIVLAPGEADDESKDGA